MTDDLLATLGLYGGTPVIGFLAGMFPLISIEVFLTTLSIACVRGWSVCTTYELGPMKLAILVVLAAIGHQIAKTICFYAGVGALERPKIKAKLERARNSIDKWNKAPNFVMVLAATVGLPPLYFLTFIAAPLMRFSFVRFTVICFLGRIGRFAFMVAVPFLF